MKLSDLQSKKIIDVENGSAVGTIIDIAISVDGQVEYFVIEQGKGFFSLNREGDTKVYWTQIEKIGEDVILIKKR